jgi:two-component SAPR family response regulator
MRSERGNNRKVVIVEKNQIIGHHISVLLASRGYDVYEEVLSISDLGTVLVEFKPDIVVINKGLFIQHKVSIGAHLSDVSSILFIVLYTLSPGDDKGFSLSRINYVGKPFSSLDILEAVLESD